jgi:hypothetical protein
MRSLTLQLTVPTTTSRALCRASLSARAVAFRVGATWLTIVALAMITGCNRNPMRVAVSGQVLIDGEPLKYGQVVFVPKRGRPSTADLDETGHFSLTSFNPNDGAAQGVHQIAVFGNEQLDESRTKWHAPRKYSFYDSSGLTQEINGPTDSLVINLTWKGDKQGKPYIEVSTSAPDSSKKGQ